MEFQPQQPNKLEVSENNKGQDIAYFFEKRKEIKSDLLEIVEASLLSNESKAIFTKQINDFIDEIESKATGLGRYDLCTYDICRNFVQSLFIGFQENDKEEKEVFKALRDHLYQKFRKEKIGY